MVSTLEYESAQQAGSIFLPELEQGNFSRSVLRAALQARGTLQEQLFALARQRRDECYPGREVEARSVIELSNVCMQTCNYCSMAKGSGIKRYVMPAEAVIQNATYLYEHGRRVVLLQSGENRSKGWLDYVTKCVKEMKTLHPDLEVILCLGNLSDEQYIQLKEAGADRYIIKFESGTAELYETWKPSDTLEERLACVRSLERIGFKVGSGNMVGMPGQTVEHIIDDLLLLGEFKLTMNSCTVFIPGENCGYKDEPMGDVDTALNSMALMRILYPERLMPTTSCLERARPGGQHLGLMAGANTVTVHDGTPEKFKIMFPIYSTKRFAPDNRHLLEAVEKANLTISSHPLQ